VTSALGGVFQMVEEPPHDATVWQRQQHWHTLLASHLRPAAPTQDESPPVEVLELEHTLGYQQPCMYTTRTARSAL